MGRSIPIGLFIVAAAMGLALTISGRNRDHEPERPSSGPAEPAPIGTTEAVPTPTAPEPGSAPRGHGAQDTPTTPTGDPKPAVAPATTPEPKPSDEEDRRYAARKVLRNQLAPQVATVANTYGAIVALGNRHARGALDCDGLARSLEATLGDGHAALEAIVVHRDDLAEPDRHAFEDELEARYRDVLTQVDATLAKLGRACEDSLLFQRALHSANDAKVL